MNNDITQLLTDWRSGNRQALNQLIESLYPQLKKMASGFMRKEAMGHTLQTTVVVNEAYARLYDADVDWQDRAHFLSVASITMRRILVDHARSKKRDKRGGDALNVTFDEGILQGLHQDNADVLALDDALNQLTEFDEEGARILEMRIFSGMSMNEVAEVLGVSLATAERRLKAVRAWLYSQLSESDDSA